MKSALYVRVSTDEQAEHGHSIDAQKERLVAYAASQGWEQYKLYVDEGYSGTNMDRPALKSMLRHIEAHKLDTVVVYRLDRLSRKQRDILFLLEDVFMPNEVVFKSATEPFDTGTPLGKAMIGILAVFAQLERDTIVERTQEGQRKRIQKGLWHGGRVPFGYDYNSELGKLVVNESEARLVRAAFRRYLNHMSLVQIADWLCRYDDSRNWSFVTVRQLLQRRTYLGRTDWGMNSKEDSHEAIINQDLFDRVQAMRAAAKGTNLSSRKHLLSGVLRCGRCGNKMYYRTYNRTPYRYNYYSCEFSEMSRGQLARRGRESRCTLPKIRSEELEAVVVDRLLETAQVDTSDLRLVLLSEHEPQMEEVKLNKQLQERVKELERRVDRWYDAFERGNIDSERASARVKDLERERMELMRQLDSLPRSTVEDVNNEPFFEARELINDAWPDMTAEEQRQVLQIAVREVTVQPNHEVQIKWNVKP